MKERPILMSAPMVRAILDGSKTQTRRIVKGINPHTTIVKERDFFERFPTATWSEVAKYGGQIFTSHGPIDLSRPEKICEYSWHFCPYGQHGDQLWVRETWQAVKPWNELGYTLCNPADVDAEIHYRATAEKMVPELPWRPSIFMPRFASRITLEITGIRVERLHDIDAHDALAEGVGHNGMGNPVVDYQNLWEKINGFGSWAANPWVWVVGFRKVES